jgi:hypothetical protein
MIICECCTICCAATANCGPRENNYPINEQRTPNTVPGTSTETKIVKSASVEQMMAVEGKQVTEELRVVEPVAEHKNF